MPVLLTLAFFNRILRYRSATQEGLLLLSIAEIMSDKTNTARSAASVLRLDL